MSRQPTTTHKSLNRPAQNKALKGRGLLTIWFDPAASVVSRPKKS
jgi:hypothetical protein